MDLLQEMLANYPGPLILVSHDRDFLDRVVTSVVAPNGNGQWLEYAGGYSDMQSQRHETQPAKAVKLDAKIKRTIKQSNPKRKLSFKEKHALETLPGQIMTLQQEIVNLEKMLSDPTLFGKDPIAFDTASSRLTQAQSELAKAEEAWLIIEIRREELESNSRK